jgi:hypothetical protein
MPRINFRKILPPGFRAVRNTASGRKDSTRWSIYTPIDSYVGDLVRFYERTGEVWSWQPYSEGHYRDGTLDECLAEIAKLAE